MHSRDSNNTRLCVPVCVRRAAELGDSIARAAALADVVELRLDCVEDATAEETWRELRRTLSARRPRTPFIVTLRPREQGGKRALESAERLSFWLSQAFPAEAGRAASTELPEFPEYVDIELELFDSISSDSSSRARFEEIRSRARVICSHHDFEGTPASLDELYERMAATPAHVVKIAVHANSIIDCIPLLRLLERARREGREMIAVSMGEAGILTRILAPSRGALLTYGALDGAQATAPGQLTASQLRDLYRVHSIDAETFVVGLVGSPVSHSVSPHVHNAAFAACGIKGVYIPFEVGDADEFMRRMALPRSREIEWNLRGLSVTAPHKSAVMAHLDWIEPSAQSISAVNTLVFEDTALLRGYNTDAAHATAPIEAAVRLEGARVAVIGAGGAARAMLWSLRERGAQATVYARDTERSRATAQTFDARIAPLDGASFEGFDVVINATPLGTRGARQDETPATARQLRGARLVYDLVYNPTETRLMREARAAGCETVGGLAMFVGQAAEQFKLWTGRVAPLEVMRAAAQAALSKS